MLQFYLLWTTQMASRNVEKGVFGNYLICLYILARTLRYHHKVIISLLYIPGCQAATHANSML